MNDIFKIILLRTASTLLVILMSWFVIFSILKASLEAETQVIGFAGIVLLGIPISMGSLSIWFIKPGSDKNKK